MLKIISVASDTDLQTVHQLFNAYASTLDFDLDFQDFEKELNLLPGAYAPPQGCILIALWQAKAAGCVALRPIDGGVCEMKRLFVKSGFRGLGIGKALAEAVIAAARQIGYTAMRLDTVPSMITAQSLYLSLGFKEIPPYRYNPVEGTKYLELRL